jgi:hypothetical protein
MSAALLEPPLAVRRKPLRAAGRAGGGPTLEERLSDAWRGLHTEGATACPVCRARMRLLDGAGECGSCGSRLS